MAYTINRYSGTSLTVVQDGTVDKTTDLTFVGKNYAGYGEIHNENFLFLLESFAGSTQPPKPISGQVWYDVASKKLKFYDGLRFKNTGGAEVSATEPTGVTIGDFWWDSGNNQLYTYDGAAFTLVGPQNAGAGVTQMQSRNVREAITLVNRGVIAGIVDDEITFIVSSATFDVASLDTDIIEAGFTKIKKGLTLPFTNVNGVTEGLAPHLYWGTASNANLLNGLSSDEFVQKSSSTFESVVQFVDAGLTVGDSQDFQLLVENGNQAVISNSGGGQDTVIKFKANNSASVLVHSATISATGIHPGAHDTFNIGASNNKWLNVYANNFVGNASSSGGVIYNSYLYLPDTSATFNTVPLRNNLGNISANIFQGTATSAQYADLAEKYSTAEELPAGTAVAVCACDDHEVEPANASDHCIGVVSTDPAVMMNSNAEGQYIGIKGRLPVRVKGPVKKGQAVYAWANGVCSTIATTAFVGIALESSTNDSEEEKLIECVLKV